MFIVTIAGTCTHEVPVSEDFQAVEQFAELKNANRESGNIGISVGDSVAVLTGDPETGGVSIRYGRVINRQGPAIRVVTREGDAFTYDYARVASV